MATPKDHLFFTRLWKERPHFSEVSGQFLGFSLNPAKYFVFSHVLSKGAYPAFRHYSKNIVLMTFEEHQLWEFEAHSRLGKEWDWVKLLKEELKREYHETSCKNY